MAEEFALKIITPERTFYEGSATFLEFTTENGPVGIYKHHEPMTMLLAPGVLMIHEQSGVRKAALHSGFVEITGETVTILAQIAEWPEEIDKIRAEQAKLRAERKLKENGSNALDELALRRALARIETLKD